VIAKIWGKILILGIIAASLFWSRQIFFHRYEPEYYENWYYYSQWNVHVSSRVISDENLYKFVGYRIARGDNPFDINYEVPPLGKYLYGLAEVWWGNGYWISVFFFCGAAILVYLVTSELTGEERLAVGASLITITTPLFAVQLRETMLDLPLVFMLLGNALFFIKYLKNGKTSQLLTAGIFLGLATGVKIGVYTPLILIWGIGLAIWYSRRIWQGIAYAASTGAGYVLAYYCYFSRHPNPIPWIRLHAKAWKFYLGAGGEVDHWNQWRGIFYNSYQSWWQSQQSEMGNWSWILPLGLLAAIMLGILAVRSRDKRWIYITGLAGIILIVNSLIPFFSRYLIPVIPFFAIFLVYSWRKIRYGVVLLCLLNVPFLYKDLVVNTPDTAIRSVANYISTRAYSELYRSVTDGQKKEMAESDFVKENETFFADTRTKEVETTVKEKKVEKETVRVKYRIKYLTQYGEMESEPTVEFVKEHNQWKLIWSWDIVWPQFEPGDKVVAEQEDIPLSILEDGQGKILARKGIWKEIYVIPRLMYDWNKYMGVLTELTGDSRKDVQDRVGKTVPDDFPRFAGYMNPLWKDEGEEMAQTVPGIRLREGWYPVIAKDFGPLNSEIAGQIKDLERDAGQVLINQANVFLWRENEKKIELPLLQPQKKEVVVITGMRNFCQGDLLKGDIKW
jgi:hypothetical protein